MKLPIYQVDAFAEKLFTGNPAAVVPLETWLPDPLMQQIAMENNLAETAFFVKNGDAFDIRWFTPGLEINLCGHATLASAYILYECMGYDKPGITFNSKSGPLYVTREGETISLDFPLWKPEPLAAYPPALIVSLGNPAIVSVHTNRDYLVELKSEADVVACRPDFGGLKQLDKMVIITAPGNSVDFVSRFFAPTAGIDEDPVTGSTHSQLIPFWGAKLGKTSMIAKQLSPRGGTLHCKLNETRVVMGGKCVFFLKGEIYV